MQKYLKERGELAFDKVFNQKIGKSQGELGSRITQGDAQPELGDFALLGSLGTRSQAGPPSASEEGL